MDNCAVPHPYHWRCQIFRSITSDSAMFEPEKTKVLNSKKGRLVDRSIGELKIFHKFISSGPENLKKSRPKKTRAESNKSISPQ